VGNKRPARSLRILELDESEKGLDYLTTGGAATRGKLEGRRATGTTNKLHLASKHETGEWSLSWRSCIALARPSPDDVEPPEEARWWESTCVSFSPCHSVGWTKMGFDGHLGFPAHPQI
jgi:hypothetical protein